MNNSENTIEKNLNESCCDTTCCSEENNTNPEGADEIKASVKNTYAKIAEQSKEQNETSCCGTGCCDTVDHAIFAEDYKKLKGYNSEADLGLGCGIPTEFASIKDGDTVLDLGSGAGNDVFVARAITGEKGKVIGVDFTEKMIEKARENNSKLGFNNVEFRQGDIEDMPVGNNEVNVIISNCVLNLVPNKNKAFEQMYRVLKHGGHFSVSDVVTSSELPGIIKTAANLYAGCIGGAIKKDAYIELIKTSGFKNVTVQKERVINIPDEILINYLSKEELEDFRKSGINILSINVYAEKL